MMNKNRGYSDRVRKMNKVVIRYGSGWLNEKDLFKHITWGLITREKVAEVMSVAVNGH